MLLPHASALERQLLEAEPFTELLRHCPEGRLAGRVLVALIDRLHVLPFHLRTQAGIL